MCRELHRCSAAVADRLVAGFVYGLHWVAVPLLQVSR